VSAQRNADTAGNAGFAREKEIRFHHCDPAGIVFYPQYFVLFNELVEDWFRLALDLPFAQMHGERRLGVPMVRVECEFLATSTMGDVLSFRLHVNRLGGSSINLSVAAMGPQGEVRVRAALTLVQVSLDTRKSVPLDSVLRERIERFRASAAAA
jgi:4-hydroxybenzoyl-CoA thioesterase